MGPLRRCHWKFVLPLALSLIATTAGAQGFAALISPPRFELKAKPGERVREVMEVTNGAQLPATYVFRTADWTLTEQGQISIFDELQPNSCRPWVAIERSKATLPGGGRLRYRFEVTPPADAPVGECRFALLVEGDEPAVASGEGFRLPVKGRIAIVVYLAVGDASPRLEVVKSGFTQVDGRRVPAVFVRNSGNAHGRISGFLSGTDGSGRSLDFTPSSFPILPGETRAVALIASDNRDAQANVQLPVTIRGTLEWESGRLPFEHRFE